jgi:hypothetical protein
MPDRGVCDVVALVGERLLDRGSRPGVIGQCHHRLSDVPRVVATTGMSGSRFDFAASLPPLRSRHCRLRGSGPGSGRPWFRGPGTELGNRPRCWRVTWLYASCLNRFDVIHQIAHCTLCHFKTPA